MGVSRWVDTDEQSKVSITSCESVHGVASDHASSVSVLFQSDFPQAWMPRKLSGVGHALARQRALARMPGSHGIEAAHGRYLAWQRTNSGLKVKLGGM